MTSLAEIEAAIPMLSPEELGELEQFIRGWREKRAPVEPAGENLWRGARERLRQIWGDRTLSNEEVAVMRDFEDAE